MSSLLRKSLRLPHFSLREIVLGTGLYLSILASTTSHAQSQTYRWDSDNNSANGVTDGAGNWTTGGGNWMLGSSSTTWQNQPGAYDVIASFGNGGTAGSVTVNGTVYAGGLQFNAVTGDGYKLSGTSSIIQLKDSALLRIDGNASQATISGFLTIDAGLRARDLTIQKTNGGIGYLDLGGSSTNKNLTGTLNIAGTNGAIFLRVKSANILNTLDKVVVNSGHTVELDAGGTYTTNFELSGVGSSTRGAIRFDNNVTLAGNIKLTGGSVALATDIDTRVATITGSITQDGVGRKLIVRQNSTNAGGTVILAGNNHFYGGLDIQAGNVVIGHSGALNSTTFTNEIDFVESTVSKRLTLNGFSIAVNGLNTHGVMQGTTQGSLSTVTNGNDASDDAATLSLVSDDGAYYFGGVISDGLGGPLSLLKNGLTFQSLSGQNTYTGATTVRKGSLELNFSNFISGNSTLTSNIISAASTLNLEGGSLIVYGKEGAAVSQTFNGTQVQGGSSTLEGRYYANPTGDILINAGAITRTDGVISFILPNGTQSATNGIRTTNVSGRMGSWATVDRSDWATVSNGNIVAFTGYTNVNRQGAGNTIASNGSSFVRIVEGGTTENVNLAEAGITDVHSLSVAANGGITSINVGQGNTLRLAADGAILIGQNAERLHIGVGETAESNGSITAGGSNNTAGNVSVINYHEANESRINSTITDNGSGVVSFSHHGSGRTVLSGNNTYTGGTYFNGGTIRISKDEALGAAPDAVDPDNLTFNGGTLNVTSATINSNRGMLLNKQGGVLQVDTSLVYGGKITGEGELAKWGNGNLNLQGENDYTGQTKVWGGTLQVDGTTGTGLVTIKTRSSVLAGTGTIRGLALIANGKVKAGGAGGNGIGTLKFDKGIVFASVSSGDPNFRAEAVFDLESGNGDRFAVTGDITLNTDTKLTASLNSGYIINRGETWTLMTWTGLLHQNGFDFGLARNGANDDLDSFDLPDLSALAGYNGEWWSISTANNALTITIVPEPGRALLLMLAGAIFTLRRRR